MLMYHIDLLHGCGLCSCFMADSHDPFDQKPGECRERVKYRYLRDAHVSY
jgi:hypothetical protein